jgi:hypothetical protein
MQNQLVKLPPIQTKPWPPVDDDNWRKLDTHQRKDLERMVRLMELVDACAVECNGRVERGASLASKRARELGLGICRRNGCEAVKSGISAKTLANNHRKWRRSRHNWRVLVRFNIIIKDKESILRSHNLTRKIAGAFCSHKGISLARWARSHGYKVQEIYALFDPEREGGKKSRAIARELSREVMAEIKPLAREVNELRKTADAAINAYKLKRRLLDEMRKIRINRR